MSAACGGVHRPDDNGYHPVRILLKQEIERLFILFIFLYFLHLHRTNFAWKTE